MQRLFGTKKGYIYLILITVCVLIFYFARMRSGHLIVSIDDAVITATYDRKTQIMGQRSGNNVYIFLPSYCKVSVIELMGSDYHFQDNQLRRIVAYEPENSSISVINSKTGDNITLNVLCSANLYTLFLDIPDSEFLSKDAYTYGKLQVFADYGREDYFEDVEVKYRGNSTLVHEKKPYSIKLKSDAEICGLAKSKDWKLLANAMDGSKILNKMIFDLGQKVDMNYTSESEFVDLYVNHEYMGTYLLVEALDNMEESIGAKDIQRLNDSMYTATDDNWIAETLIKGFFSNVQPELSDFGVLIEKDYHGFYNKEKTAGFISNLNYHFTIKSPDNASLEEVYMFRDCFQRLESSLYLQNSEALDYIDLSSFAKRYLIEELVFNCDAQIASYYFYKKYGDEKIYAGPLWDYDGVLGESNGDSLNYNNTILNNELYRKDESYPLDWDERLLGYEEYWNYTREELVKILPVIEELYLRGIDQYAETIRDSVQMDMQRWDYGKDTAGHYYNYENNIRYTKFFLYQRTRFLCEKFALPEPELLDVTNDEMHTVSFFVEDKEKTIHLKDGAFISPDMLPEYNSALYSGWFYVRDDLEYSPYLPVFEDVSLYLREIN